MRKIPKRWRELPIKSRLEIPVKYFNIDEKTLDKIRKISDSKKRLIEAARIQFELFGDIHSYLTTWIAGYGSDVVIRNNFGSTKALLELFMKLPNTENQNFSWADIKRNIKIPKEMDENLAKETGLHIGDGNLYITNHEGNLHSYRYCISGDLTDELIFHTEYIANLMKKLYNINGTFVQRIDKNSIDSKYHSKAIVQFKNETLKLPIGSKKDIKIPNLILKNNDFMKKCISGIIDTDFNITSSLAISGKINNLFVAKEMHLIFNKNNIDHVYRLYDKYARFYIPKKGAKNILTDWKLDNPKHISKFLVFEEFKKFIPFTTTTERLALLDGKIDINELEKISEKRKINLSHPNF